MEVAGILRSFMPEGVRVLDVGCATGSVTLIANRGKNNQVIGVEPDETRAEIARSRGMEVISGVLDEALLERLGPFDVIMFADVLEHLPNPTETLELALKGLKEDGVVLASVPNVAHWTVRANLLLGRFNYAPAGIMDATHLRWFTARTFGEFFRRLRMGVVTMRQTAGTELAVYRRLRWLPEGARNSLTRALTRAFPRLFGCQHVVKARRAPPQ
jgi:2-polyprenyl-3-methyl-5-hydroxy-6-metoxy-1,4-benzoquinol methylase